MMIFDGVGWLISHLFDLLLLPFRALPPFWGLLFLSVLSGLWMILVFRAVSDQRRIAVLRKRMGGEVLGILLHVSRPGTVALFAGRLIASNTIYLWHLLRPLLVIAIPFALTWGQLEARYATDTLSDSTDPVTYTLSYRELPPRDSLDICGDGISFYGPTVMVDTLREASFRIVALNAAPKTLSAGALTIPVGRTADWNGATLSRGFRVDHSLERLFRPWLSSAPELDDAPIAGDMSLPGTSYGVLGGHWSWAVVFLVFSSLAAIGGAIVFKVRI